MPCRPCYRRRTAGTGPRPATGDVRSIPLQREFRCGPLRTLLNWPWWRGLGSVLVVCGCVPTLSRPSFAAWVNDMSHCRLRKKRVKSITIIYSLVCLLLTAPKKTTPNHFGVWKTLFHLIRFNAIEKYKNPRMTRSDPMTCSNCVSGGDMQLEIFFCECSCSANTVILP